MPDAGGSAQPSRAALSLVQAGAYWISQEAWADYLESRADSCEHINPGKARDFREAAAYIRTRLLKEQRDAD